MLTFILKLADRTVSLVENPIWRLHEVNLFRCKMLHPLAGNVRNGEVQDLKNIVELVHETT